MKDKPLSHYLNEKNVSFTDAIKSHLLQWFQEKNRKIEDGYDYEVSLFITLLYRTLRSFKDININCI